MQNNYASCIPKWCVSSLVILLVLSFSFEVNAQSLIRPGKSDFFFRNSGTVNQYNYILWTPLVKGGAGVFYNADGVTPARMYLGGYIRPLRDIQGKGEIIVGGHIETQNLAKVSEFQIEYRSRLGISGGGGFVAREFGPDVAWAKLSYRGKFGDNWKYTTTLQAQYIDVGTDSKVYPGGYLAIYNPKYRIAGGYEGEQWRMQVGYIGEKSDKFLRPAFEVLYVDNTVGSQLGGPRFLFVNATLRYWFGFLSNPASLGRAMGPTGLEYGNPLGYLTPGTWNRRLNPWELGTAVDFRLVHLAFAKENFRGKAELLFFPVELARRSTPSQWDNVFLGTYLAYASVPGFDVDAMPGVMAGYYQKFPKIHLGVQAEYDIDNNLPTFSVGVLHWFKPKK